MTTYIFLYFVLTLNCFFDNQTNSFNQKRTITFRLRYYVIFFILFIFTGFRDQIGVDWNNYKYLYYLIIDGGSYENIGFSIVSRIVDWLGLPWYFFNVFIAFIFFFGLHSFVLSLPWPGIALLYALPYFIFVVSTNYVNQAAAIGLIFYAFKFIENRKLISFTLLVMLAALFHSSAILFLIVPIYVSLKNPNTLILASLTVISLTFLIYTAQPFQSLISRFFIANNLVSKGAEIRLFLYSFLSISFMYLPLQKIELGPTVRSVLVMLALISPLLLLSTLFGISNVLADRVALYTFPTQLALFGYLPRLLRKQFGQYEVLVMLVSIFSISIFVFWVSTTRYLNYWVPYNSMLF